MSRQLICDVNVFYNLGSGRLRLSDIAQDDDHVAYSPLSVLEIAGKLTEANHEQRRAVAQAILDTGATQLLDPESFLATIFGLELSEPPFDFSHAVKAIAQSRNMQQLKSGVADRMDKVQRRMKPHVAEVWRHDCEGKWVEDFLTIMKDTNPRFARWYNPNPSQRAGSVPRLRGKSKEEFLAMVGTEEWRTVVLLSCQKRAFLRANRAAFTLSPEIAQTFLQAVGKVACYRDLYTQYLIRLLTEGALPELNDSGDLELFIYSTDDSQIVVTAERKWVTLAQRAGFAQRVRRV